MSVQILIGDCREMLRTLPAESVQCVVTSPPYFGLRDYGVDGQIGLEATPQAFVTEMVAVFREVRRVLKDDGTLWLNLGDSYATGAGKVGNSPGGGKQGEDWKHKGLMTPANRMPLPGLKPKDLIGIPWRVAFALQDDGWYLRQDIIWHKPNPMPESVRDRCTKAHEYIFLMSKSERYYFDSKAIQENAVGQNAHDLTGSGYAAPGQKPNRGNRLPGNKTHKGTTAYEAGDERHRTKAGLVAYAKRQRALVSDQRKELRTDTESRHRTAIPGGQSMQAEPNGFRNKRSVWTITTKPFKEAHFATFPPELPELCIKAGSKPGDTILDPFGGSGTTGLVADRLVRNAILCELNPDYAKMAHVRINGEAPLFAEVT